MPNNIADGLTAEQFRELCERITIENPIARVIHDHDNGRTCEPFVVPTQSPDVGASDDDASQPVVDVEPVPEVRVPDARVADRPLQRPGRIEATFTLDTGAFDRLNAALQGIDFRAARTSAREAVLGFNALGESLRRVAEAQLETYDTAESMRESIREFGRDTDMPLVNTPSRTFSDAVDDILRAAESVRQTDVPSFRRRIIHDPVTTRDDLFVSEGIAWMWNRDQGEWQMVRGLLADATVIDAQPYAKSEVPLSDRRARVSQLNDNDLVQGASWAAGQFSRRWERYVQRLAARNLRPRDRTFLGRVERTHMKFLPAMIAELVLRGFYNNASQIHSTAFTWPVSIADDGDETSMSTFVTNVSPIIERMNPLLRRDAGATSAPFPIEPEYIALVGRGRMHRRGFTKHHLAVLVERPGQWYRLLPSWAIEREFHGNMPQAPTHVPEVA